MNILIVGCGRVGRRLVHVLERLGHDVSVLDEDAANLALLNELEPPFSGMAVAGVPIDGDVLRSAGIEACDAVAAVTKDDNINLMVAQIARELFGVKHVIARVAELAGAHGVSMTEISLSWLLTKVTSPVVGATKLHHIEGAARAVDLQLTDEEIASLEAPYVPHRLVGVMAQNTPAAAKDEHVWSTGSQKI